MGHGQQFTRYGEGLAGRRLQACILSGCREIDETLPESAESPCLARVS